MCSLTIVVVVFLKHTITVDLIFFFVHIALSVKHKFMLWSINLHNCYNCCIHILFIYYELKNCLLIQGLETPLLGKI